MKRSKDAGNQLFVTRRLFLCLSSCSEFVTWLCSNEGNHKEYELVTILKSITIGYRRYISLNGRFVDIEDREISQGDFA